MMGPEGTTMIQTVTITRGGAKSSQSRYLKQDMAGAKNPALPQAKPSNGEKVPAKVKV